MASELINFGLLWHGDEAARQNLDLESSRFALAAQAIRDQGMTPVGIVYNDEIAPEVEAQLLGLDAVQVWVNPISDGRDRSVLDALLCRVSGQGVLVFTHPDLILKMGTKQVLYDTKDMSWGSDVAVHRSLDQLQSSLSTRLADGKARVIKQYRGHSGGGIWKVQVVDAKGSVQPSDLIQLRHAQRGCVEQVVTFSEAMANMQPYFESGGLMVDQAYQDRLPEGMTRIYLVGDEVGGFGHQAINALYPAEPGADSDAAPQPGPRLYHPPNEPAFRQLKKMMEARWLDELCACLALTREDLPLLWDVDLLLGPRDSDGNDTYVLCEINVSSVSPYPEWANLLLARTLRSRVQSRRALA